VTASSRDRSDRHLARIADGRDFAEGLEAFFAKRAPRLEEAQCLSTV
jgi:hypothetical protein